MVSHQVLLIPRILLQFLILFQAAEDGLAEAVVVRHIRHLRIEQLCHESPGLRRVVDLGPPLDSILDHEVLGHGRRDGGHVASVVLFTHPRLAVAEDGEAEVFTPVAAIGQMGGRGNGGAVENVRPGEHGCLRHFERRADQRRGNLPCKDCATLTGKVANGRI